MNITQFNNYNELDPVLDKLYANEKYEEALGLLKEAEKQFPDDLFDIVFYQSAIYSQINQYDDCFSKIKYLIEAGYACPLNSRWFKPLQQYPQYAQLLQENKRLLSQMSTKMEYKVHLPEEYTANHSCPLFIVLHGDGGAGNIEHFRLGWPPDVMNQAGFIVVYIQSSQPLYHNNYAWRNDRTVAIKDISDCYNRLLSEYEVDTNFVILGGFSGGAITAVELAMLQPFPIHGFICFCPEIKPEGFTFENVNNVAQQGVRGVFLEGETAVPVADEVEMMDTFDEVGLPYQFYVNEGIGHSFPEDFADKLKSALTFISR